MSKAFRAFVGLLVVALCIATFGVLFPTAASAEQPLLDTSLCKGTTDSRIVSGSSRVPVAVCFEPGTNLLVIHNVSEGFVRFDPGLSSYLRTDNSGADLMDRALARAWPSVMVLPPGGRMSFEVRTGINEGTARFRAEFDKNASAASMLLGLIPVSDALEATDVLVKYVIELADVALQYGQCVKGANFLQRTRCQTKLWQDMAFAAARAGVHLGVSTLKVVYKALLALFETAPDLAAYTASGAYYYGTSFSITPPPAPASVPARPASTTPTTTRPSAGGCSPAVPSGNRGVADTTSWDADPCSGVFVRTEPTFAAAKPATLAQGLVFDIECQQAGEAIADSRGYRSTLWNRIRYGTTTGWVSDVWSGKRGDLQIPCGGSAPQANGCYPPVPGGMSGVSDSTQWDPDPCSGVNLRSGASYGSPVIGALPQGVSFGISCQVHGGVISDSRGYSSDIWNRTTTPNGVNSWVSDVWSGHRGWLNAPCAPPAQCNPPVPDGPNGVADTTRWTPDPCSGVNVRERAVLDSPVLGELPQGTVFPINCQVHGQAISNSDGWSSDIWNNVTALGLNGWVADTWSGRKGWLSLDCNATPPGAPGKPAVSAGDGGLTASWTPPLTNGGALIDQELQLLGEADAVLRTATLGTGASTALQALENGASYRVRVRSRNHKGVGPWSVPSDPVAPEGVPWAPSGVVADWTGAQIGATWAWGPAAANGSTVTGFETEFKDVATGQVVRQLGDAAARGAGSSDGGVGSRWVVRVRAVAGAVSGAWSEWSAPATVATVPAQPSAPVVRFDDGVPVLQWATPQAAGTAAETAQIDVQRVDDATSEAADVVAAASAGTASVAGLAPGARFQFRVRGLSRTGTSTWSAGSAPVTIPAVVDPAAPVRITAGAQGGPVRIEWSGVKGASSGYRLRVLDYTAQSVDEQLAAGTTAELPDFPTDHDVRFQVAGLGTDGVSGDWSREVLRSGALAASDVRLSVSPGTIAAGQRVTVTYSGEPGAVIEVLSRTQPATVFSRIGTVTLGADGLGSSSHAPQKNTRMAARPVGGSVSSEQPLIAVRSVASFNVQRVGVRTYAFTGRVYPALSQRLVNIYRNGALVAQARSAPTGVYSVTRTLGGGTYTFQARTPNDTSNLGTSSRQLSVLIR